MPWGAMVSMALQLIGMAIKAKGNDSDAQAKFNELSDILMQKQISSVNVKIERDGRVARLKSKIDGENNV